MKFYAAFIDEMAKLAQIVPGKKISALGARLAKQQGAKSAKDVTLMRHGQGMFSYQKRAAKPQPLRFGGSAGRFAGLKKTPVPGLTGAFA